MEENHSIYRLKAVVMKKNLVRLACGVDMAKDDFKVCFGALNQSGSFVVKASRSYKNTKSGIRDFLAWVQKNLLKFNPDNELPFQLLLETTGVYHEALCLSAYEGGLPVCLEVALRVKKYLQSIGQYSKTDKLDARGICQMGCERKLKLWQPVTPHIMAIRSALRHRKSLVENRVSLKNQLHALDHSAYKRNGIKRSINRLIKQLDKEVEGMEASIDELYQADTELYTRLEPIVQSVKGVGVITALTIVAETNGFAQIQSAKQLASYTGYDIIENQSGNSTKPTKISKRGNARIRKEMYMAAVAHINTKSGPIYQLYERVSKKNPKAYKVANVAVQRKLLILVYTLFKNRTAYDPEYHLKKVQKNSSEQCPELHGIAQA